MNHTCYFRFLFTSAVHFHPWFPVYSFPSVSLFSPLSFDLLIRQFNPLTLNIQLLQDKGMEGKERVAAGGLHLPVIPIPVNWEIFILEAYLQACLPLPKLLQVSPATQDFALSRQGDLGR